VSYPSFSSREIELPRKKDSKEEGKGGKKGADRSCFTSLLRFLPVICLESEEEGERGGRKGKKKKKVLSFFVFPGFSGQGKGRRREKEKKANLLLIITFPATPAPDWTSRRTGRKEGEKNVFLLFRFSLNNTKKRGKGKKGEKNAVFFSFTLPTLTTWLFGSLRLA